MLLVLTLIKKLLLTFPFPVVLQRWKELDNPNYNYSLLSTSVCLADIQAFLSSLCCNTDTHAAIH